MPLTILRDGPYGPGMVQRWIEDADPEEVVDLVPVEPIPAGWLPVLRAVDSDGSDVAVVHADTPALALLAGFDLVVNNADRKGSHVLPLPDGRVLGVDHGLMLPHRRQAPDHPVGLGGQAAAPRCSTASHGCGADVDGELGERLGELMTAHRDPARCGTGWTGCSATKKFPRAPAHRTPIPWPPL